MKCKRKSLNIFLFYASNLKIVDQIIYYLISPEIMQNHLKVYTKLDGDIETFLTKCQTTVANLTV